MAKTIRSHLTSPFIHPELFVGLLLYFQNLDPNEMDLRVLHFPTSLQVKQLAPKGKKVRMDHPFILGFCQNVTFDIVFTIIVSYFPERKLSSITAIC